MLRVFTDECIMKREYVVCVENMRKNKTIVWKYNLIRIFNPTLKKKNSGAGIVVQHIMPSLGHPDPISSSITSAPDPVS